MRQILTGSVLLALMAMPALAVDYGGTPPVKYHYRIHHALPQCDAPGVVAKISERFAYQDAHIIGSGVAITSIGGIYEHALRTGGPSLIDRRYCRATAWLSNGRKSEVVYLIEGPKLGHFSIGWHVESCLPAYDPYRVYDASCRSIRGP